MIPQRLLRWRERAQWKHARAQLERLRLKRSSNRLLAKIYALLPQLTATDRLLLSMDATRLEWTMASATIPIATKEEMARWPAQGDAGSPCSIVPSGMQARRAPISLQRPRWWGFK